MSAAIKVNGQQKTFEQGLPATLSELLATMDIDAVTVVAEVDGQIVERRDFTRTSLTEGQSIELIRFVGGG